MEEFVAFLVKPLLSQPDGLRITVSPHAVSIQVDPADMGRVIGKRGVIITALRNLIHAYCSLHQSPPVTLTLLESTTPTGN